jgi:hypothetical protein
MDALGLEPVSRPGDKASRDAIGLNFEALDEAADAAATADLIVRAIALEKGVAVGRQR